MTTTRRIVLGAMLSAPALPMLGPSVARARQPPLDFTPQCADDDEPTIAQTPGPYYKPASPLKQDLAADVSDGERLLVAGYVLDTGCRPVPKALVEIWHADHSGAYDNVGYRLRGHQFCDDRGRWWFSTIVPSPYPGRTRHIHFKVQRPGKRVLTTQLYFPGEPLNERDGIFDERLLLQLSETADGKFGRFDFVV